MSISDWSSDVCSSDLAGWQNEAAAQTLQDFMKSTQQDGRALFGSTEISAKKLTALPQWARVLGKMRTERKQFRACLDNEAACTAAGLRSEEHTSELQSLMRIAYAVFCLQKKTQK